MTTLPRKQNPFFEEDFNYKQIDDSVMYDREREEEINYGVEDFDDDYESEVDHE
jgi:hypothetical protein